jgi:hypothetical protein
MATSDRVPPASTASLSTPRVSPMPISGFVNGFACAQGVIGSETETCDPHRSSSRGVAGATAEVATADPCPTGVVRSVRTGTTNEPSRYGDPARRRSPTSRPFPSSRRSAMPRRCPRPSSAGSVTRRRRRCGTRPFRATRGGRREVGDWNASEPSVESHDGEVATDVAVSRRRVVPSIGSFGRRDLGRSRVFATRADDRTRRRPGSGRPHRRRRPGFGGIARWGRA